MNEHDVQAARLRKQTALVNLVGAVGSLLVMAWYLTPEHERKQLAMRATEKIRRLLGGAAARAGRQSMGLELATGRREYGVPYVLSVARDKAAQAYEKMRSAQ